MSQLEWEDVTPEEVKKLYYDDKLSTYEIGDLYGVSDHTIRNFMNRHKLKRRSVSSARIIQIRKSQPSNIDKILVDEITSIDHEAILSELEFLSDLPVTHYKRVARENISIPVPLKTLESGVIRDASITIVLSDTHLGHSDFLPDTYHSTIETLVRVITFLHKNYNIKKVNIVLNGDIVSGRDVYRKQILDNLLPKGHWQVFLAEILMDELVQKVDDIITVNCVYIIKGTHEDQAENYMLYLKTALEKKWNTKYLSRGNIINVAEPLGNYNVFFTHGKGKSDYYPVSLVMIRDIWKSLSDYKSKDIVVERVAVGHTHWLNPDLQIEGIILDVTGGFQLWEYSTSQRPCGMLMYLYTDNECTCIPIRPNADTESKEKSQNSLEYKVMSYYSKKLLEHVNKIEGVKLE